MNRIIKHKLKFIGLLLLLLLYFPVKSFFFNSPEFLILNQMTRIDTTANRITEIILVKNHPANSSDLKKLILGYTSGKKVQFENIHQIFIKENDYTFLPALFLTENFSYEDKTTPSDKLDNADFLAERNRYIKWDKTIVDTVNCFIEKYSYYKK